MISRGVFEYYKKTKELGIPSEDAKEILRINYGCTEALLGDTSIIQSALTELKEENKDLTKYDPEKVYNRVEAIKHRYDHLFPQFSLGNQDFF